MAAKFAAAADLDSILDGGHAVDAIFRRQRIHGATTYRQTEELPHEAAPK
jgi:hypothetical protein